MSSMKRWMEEALEALEALEDIEKAEIERLEAKKTYKYKDPVTNEVFEYEHQGLYKKNGRTLVPVNALVRGGAQSLWKKTVAEYEEGQMQREQLMKMHHQLMEIEEYLEGIKFEDWTKDMISKSEIYIQNIYDFVEANKPLEDEKEV